MDRFIAYSPSSRESLKLANLASTLPLNCIIVGSKAVGKNHLAKVVSPSARSYEALELEKSIFDNNIDFSSIIEIIITNIYKLKSSKNIFDILESNSIRVIATTTEYKDIYDDYFQVRIDVEDLSKRREDVEYLKEEYIKDAKRLFMIDGDFDDIEIDISENAISLRQSIFRSILLNSLKKEQIMEILESFFKKELPIQSSYKELLPIFEIPLLKASKKVFRSQLQMAKKLDINRNTLRKKLMENGIDG